MTNQSATTDNPFLHLTADCQNCFGLCCAALPFATSADFPFNKDAGIPCPNLEADYRCGVHESLRGDGFLGCAAYDCFGAGQKVSQLTYGGNDWKKHPTVAAEMFQVFPLMQQLHELLYYLKQARFREEAEPIYKDLEIALKKTAELTKLPPAASISLDIHAHRSSVNELLLQASKLVRATAANLHKKGKEKQIQGVRKRDFIGRHLQGADLKGVDFRGALLIAADLRDSDMRMADMIGADFRGADLSGADLRGSLFLTQAQVNSAKGSARTKLPAFLRFPDHWSQSPDRE
ncbi:Pentapeptide repeat-containing protein [Evansella caseinilytica]|uniref:Pentapeptide repeat-containing protein n=1 Tax=Evansella caseinilytica TaxID=1503961 RepID=A0A1H3H9F4_9BACI|nr:pentapeptide repeat-containing protein [Evansella caseinilytica]SDY11414.1 Pentapeptide repeat-containing protein [Evansella caseinilytica]